MIINNIVSFYNSFPFMMLTLFYTVVGINYCLGLIKIYKKLNNVAFVPCSAICIQYFLKDTIGTIYMYFQENQSRKRYFTFLNIFNINVI